MDWRKYAKHLEDIIERIDMADQTRILVNALIERAKKRIKTMNYYIKGNAAKAQQMACCWLREEKGIHPELELCTDNEFSFTIYKLDGKRTVLYEEKYCWTKPEDAVEAALEYALSKLI